MASTVPSPDDFADRRAYPRVAVALPAFLEASGERHHVQILDLSAGGAKLSCAVALGVGTVVTLDCGMLGRSAEVRWQDGAVLGLCFASQLDPRDVADLAERSRALAARMQAPG
jgi:hypothetical protein